VYEISAVLVDTQYRFVRWETTNVSAVIDDISDPTTTVKLKDGSATVYAYFTAPYSLSLSRTPTNQVYNPNFGYEYVVSVNSEFVSNTANGTVWKISTRASDTTYKFINWTPSNSYATINYVYDTVTTVRLTGAATVTANFAAGYTPTIYRYLSGTSNTATNTITNMTHVSTTTTGTTMWNITANLYSTDTAYRFSNWYNATSSYATITNTSISTTSLTLTGNASIYAYFVPAYTLKITNNVIGSTAIPDTTVKRGYIAGSTYSNLLATVPSGYKFVGWTRSNTNVTITDSTKNPTSLTFASSTTPGLITTVTANFLILPVTVDSIMDTRDTKKYKAIKIGGQTWMAENLNYSGNSSEGEGGGD
jgi:hypothetical protein